MMIIQKIKIIFIHFIRKPLFIFWVKWIRKKSIKELTPNYFLSQLNYHDLIFKEKLIEIESKNKILADAEIVLQNKFKTLGSELTHLGEKINWQRDFKSGRIWDKDFYTEIDSKHSIEGSDIKVTWELSRFHQAIWLGKAFLATSDEKYAEKYFELVSDWIDANPFCYGVNWNCAMEVAIRSVNWIIAHHIFKTSKNLTNDVEKKILNSLYQHGLFIRSNLEYGRRNGNHYLSDLMGLVWLGGFFSNYSFGKRWLNFAKKELDKEIEIQVYEDGVDYEKSTYYQRLVTEILYNSQIALKFNGLSLTERSLTKLEKMFQFISSYILENTIPNIGDNDNGRVTQYSFDEQINDLRYTLSVGSILFRNSEFISSLVERFGMRNVKISSDALFLFGLKEVADFESLHSALRTPHSAFNNALHSALQSSASFAFPQGGFYIMRSEESFVFIDSGDIGMNGWGGHGHNDVFSFEFAIKGLRFIVDPGTYCYTSDPELRQKFRSTSSHNTIMIDNTEQAEFLNLFRIKEDLTAPRVLEWSSNDEKDILIAEHFGYARLKHLVVHRRKFEFNKKEETLIIVDQLDGQSEHKINYFLHFHPKVEVKKVSESSFQLTRDEKNLLIEIKTQIKEPKIEIEKSHYSESYGRIEESLRLHFSSSSQLPCEIMTIIKVIE
ncbi:MAG: heparinase II/III family protein [Bacteroidetes bacterium]|nr:heparinase II/III family protein [Bacteroidota bacterium]MBU2586468.1 heparinase II/III family protein [Bacteroidota bacterium]